MSAALAFTTVTHRPTAFALDGDGDGDGYGYGDGYVDEPCSSDATNVSGSGESNNVIFVNFPAASSPAASTPNASTPTAFRTAAPKDFSSAAGFAGGAPRTRLRLTRRGRRVIALLVALPVVMAAFAFALNGGGAVASAETSSTSFSYVTVEAGQSLWSLAQTLAPTADPRDVIAEIVSLNQIQGEIQPGQRLALPAGYGK
jgi:hypothetical protein